MKNVTLKIDGLQITVPFGITILEAAKYLNIKIPTLCYHPDQNVKANCRICVVKVKGIKNLVTACSYPVSDGMEIMTNAKEVMDTRKTVLKLILASHNSECTTCVRNGSCELQELAHIFGLSSNNIERDAKDTKIDISTPSIVKDLSKCIKCGRCMEVCQEVQKVGVLYQMFRSDDMEYVAAFNKELMDTNCVLCGQCALVCPVGAIYEKQDIDKVWDAIYNPEKHVVVQVAPAVRVSIGEIFGYEPGTITTGQMVCALRRIGFDRVFDTDFTADLTIMEEGNELIHRINNSGKLPMITSCSPGWIKFCEHFYPELLEHLSTCKSPQQMFGALTKTYYAEKVGIDPKNIFVVSIMPCTAKKYEASRPEMAASGSKDVDVVLTTREFGRMIKQAFIDLKTLPDEDFDEPLGISTGAGVIFGATGGVMEAALRTVYELLTGSELENIDFYDVRGMKGIKEATVKINGSRIKVAVAHNLGNARKIMEEIKSGKSEYSFVEIMCCPGGCIGGGGQPYGSTNEVKKKRIKGIYNVDMSMPLRKSHENPAVIALYKEFLNKPLSEKAHHLLHTAYEKRENNY